MLAMGFPERSQQDPLLLPPPAHACSDWDHRERLRSVILLSLFTALMFGQHRLWCSLSVCPSCTVLIEFHTLLMFVRHEICNDLGMSTTDGRSVSQSSW